MKTRSVLRFATAPFAKSLKALIPKCFSVERNKVLLAQKRNIFKWMTSFTKCAFTWWVVRGLQGYKWRNKLKREWIPERKCEMMNPERKLQASGNSAWNQLESFCKQTKPLEKDKSWSHFQWIALVVRYGIRPGSTLVSGHQRCRRLSFC